MSAAAAAALAAALLTGGAAGGQARLRALRPPVPGSGVDSPVRPVWLAVGAIAVAAVVWAVVGGASGVVAALPAGVLAAVSGHRLLRSDTGERTDRADLAAGWELVSVCLEAGLPVAAAVAAAADRLTGRAGVGLRRVAGLLALGSDPPDAWREAEAVAALAVFARAAARSAGTGAALADVARAEGARVRAELADEADARGQRAAVLIAGPLGLCYLPAFLTLGIAPVVIGLAGETLARWT